MRSSVPLGLDELGHGGGDPVGGLVDRQVEKDDDLPAPGNVRQRAAYVRHRVEPLRRREPRSVGQRDLPHTVDTEHPPVDASVVVRGEYQRPEWTTRSCGLTLRDVSSPVNARYANARRRPRRIASATRSATSLSTGAPVRSAAWNRASSRAPRRADGAGRGARGGFSRALFDGSLARLEPLTASGRSPSTTTTAWSPESIRGGRRKPGRTR